MTTFFGQLALIAAALFTGAAFYVGFAEHPARLKLEDRPLLDEWKPSYARGALMQASLAVIGFLLGLLAWWQSGHWLWMLGALALVANWPFTMLCIMPTNNALKAMDPANAGQEMRELMIKWGGLHAVRTTLGIASTLIFLWASLR